MSESKTFVFGNDANNANNSLLASILPTLQNRGVDTGYLMGLMNNGNGGFFGNNGGFQDIIALIVIAAIFGNGNFGFGGWGNNNNGNSTEREMLMSAIQRNGLDLNQLAGSLNCSVGRVQDAVTAVSTQICNLAGQQGLSFQQVINSIQAGNSAIASQLASCCCDIRTAIADSNYLTERGFCNTNQILAKGFSDIGYETQRQTCDIEKAIASSTEQILAGQRAAEMREMQDKLDALREKNAQQAVFLNNAQQTAQFSAMIAPIAQDLEKIKCKLPETVTIPATPDYVPINRSINIPYTPYCGVYGLGAGYGLGCQNGSLWG